MPDGSNNAPLFGIGHNQGPPLELGISWAHFCWKKASGHKSNDLGS